MSNDGIITKIQSVLRTVVDPELGFDIWNIGCIYGINFDAFSGLTTVTMTFTSPNCPFTEEILNMVQDAVIGVVGVTKVNIEIVWDPAWHQGLASPEVQLELGW
jgi:metal-sulfur cluster biosynthetic enzyme